jgi:single-stranded DNA-binding protein
MTKAVREVHGLPGEALILPPAEPEQETKMNVLTTVARVVADATLRDAGSGRVCSVRLAIDSGVGERRSSFFVNASIWRGSEQLAPRLVKGAEVHVSGELSVRDYTSRDGKAGQALDLNVDRVGRIRAPQGAAETTSRPEVARGWHGPQPSLSVDEIPF